jgi:hypothetical protein
MVTNVIVIKVRFEYQICHSKPSNLRQCVFLNLGFLICEMELTITSFLSVLRWLVRLDVCSIFSIVCLTPSKKLNKL